jgi:hypothetical protein
VSALDRPSEVLLVAFFDAVDKAEAAARALLHSGLGVDQVAFLARESRGAALKAVPLSASLRLPGVGQAVARGSLAVELGHGSAAGSGEERLGTALRRLGLSVTDVPRLARAVQADLILVLAAVPREEALGWGRALQGAGAVSLTARPRLGYWPPSPTRALSPPVGRRRARREPLRLSARSSWALRPAPAPAGRGSRGRAAGRSQ